jgi:hypothetical protein
MIKYKNLNGSSGVINYQTGPDYIKVKFIDGTIYKYTCTSAGKKIIEQMKRLAKEGKGLSTYISQTVKDKFEH